MTRGLIALPQLDGTREATDARLEAWLARGTSGELEDAVHGLGLEVDELCTFVTAVRGIDADDRRDVVDLAAAVRRSARELEAVGSEVADTQRRAAS